MMKILGATTQLTWNGSASSLGIGVKLAVMSLEPTFYEKQK
jgi:hypothetical protein